MPSRPVSSTIRSCSSGLGSRWRLQKRSTSATPERSWTSSASVSLTGAPASLQRPPDRGHAERALGAEVLGGIGDERVPEVERDEADHEAKRGLRLPRYASIASRGSPVAKDWPNALTPYSTAVR